MEITQKNEGFYVEGKPIGKYFQIGRIEGPFKTKEEAESFIASAPADFDKELSLGEQAEHISRFTSMYSSNK